MNEQQTKEISSLNQKLRKQVTIIVLLLIIIVIEIIVITLLVNGVIGPKAHNDQVTVNSPVNVTIK